MSALINKLFSQSQSDAIRSLWEDKDSRFLTEKEIAKKIIEHQEIIDEMPLAQLMFIASSSTFASSEVECHDVASIIYWGMRRVDVLPLITEHKDKDLAYRCLISLGFFRKAMERRCNQYGAPSPCFYRKIGICSFNKIGMEDIGNHFCQWEGFIGEMFT